MSYRKIFCSLLFTFSLYGLIPFRLAGQPPIEEENHCRAIIPYQSRVIIPYKSQEDFIRHILTKEIWESDSLKKKLIKKCIRLTDKLTNHYPELADELSEAVIRFSMNKS